MINLRTEQFIFEHHPPLPLSRSFDIHEKVKIGERDNWTVYYAVLSSTELSVTNDYYKLLPHSIIETTINTAKDLLHIRFR